MELVIHGDPSLLRENELALYTSPHMRKNNRLANLGRIGETSGPRIRIGRVVRLYPPGHVPPWERGEEPTYFSPLDEGDLYLGNEIRKFLEGSGYRAADIRRLLR